MGVEVDMSEWKEGIWLGISAMLMAMLITFAVVLGGVAKEVSNIQQDEINTIAQMKEYRKWAIYDDTIVSSADVISCIIANKSNIPAIIVSKSISFGSSSNVFDFSLNEAFIVNHNWNISNPYYLWDGTRKDTTRYPDYTFDELNEYIPPKALYHAHIKKDLNGSVRYIWFKRVLMWLNYEDVEISGETLIECIIESRYYHIEFHLKDDTDYRYFSWDEYSLTEDNLLALKQSIVSEGTYNAIINRDLNGDIEYIQFRRVV